MVTCSQPLPMGSLSQVPHSSGTQSPGEPQPHVHRATILTERKGHGSLQPHTLRGCHPGPKLEIHSQLGGTSVRSSPLPVLETFHPDTQSPTGHLL